MKLNLLALYFDYFSARPNRLSLLFRLPGLLTILLGTSLSASAQAEKYANVEVFPDNAILAFLQKAYPNDKLNYYDVKLNGRMQHVKNYYDYIAFRCVLLDSVLVPPTRSVSDSLRSVSPDSTGILRDSAGKRIDSAASPAADSFALRNAVDSTSKKRDTAAVAPVSPPADTSLGLKANTTNQLAAVLSASNDISLSENNVIAKRVVDSTWVLGDTLISARRGMTHPTETSVPTVTFSDPPPVPASYVITADTVYMINFGANAAHRPSLIWIYHSKDSSTHIVVGSGDFKEEMLMLQSFCDGLGPKLSPYLVEIWDLFVKSHQSAMYTPVYDHEAHYPPAPVPAETPATQ